MTILRHRSDSVSSSEAFTQCTEVTPPESLTGEPESKRDALGDFSSVPCAGFTFVIRSASCGRLLTLLDGGQVVLAQPSHSGMTHWECVETDGWLGFRNTITRNFLGHGGWNNTLQCSKRNHNWWEMFQAQHRREGGYVLLMSHWALAFPVGLKPEHGLDKLAKINPRWTKGLVWEFEEVEKVQAK